MKWVVLLLLSTAVLAKTTHAPLPEKITKAKTIYIDNRSGFANIGDRAYDEVVKRGRFTIVTSADKADVIFLITATEYTGGYRTTGTIDNGDVDLTTKASTTGSTFLTVVDPTTGDALWSDTRSWSPAKYQLPGMQFVPHSAIRALIKELHSRLRD